MRRIAVINQKGGVGKTTTCTNLGAALARLGRRVLLVDMDPQANLTMHLAIESLPEQPSIYTVLLGETALQDAQRATSTERLFLVPSNIDLSGAELELASKIGRETILKDAIDEWEKKFEGTAEAFDYIIYDCAPSLGLLTINALTATREVLITLQTEFFALQGMSKLIEIVGLLQRRMNPELVISGILPCLYDSRLKLAREVLAEIRSYFPTQVLPFPIRTNIKLAEAPSYGQTIFEYAADSNGAEDHLRLARSVIEQEGAQDPELALRYAEPQTSAEGETDSAAAAGPEAAIEGERLAEGESTPAARAGDHARGAASDEGRAASRPLGGEAKTAPEVQPTSTSAAHTDAARTPESSARAGGATAARAAERRWESPEVGGVELEPRPRQFPPAKSGPRQSDAPDELPPLPPDAFEMTGYPSL